MNEFVSFGISVLFRAWKRIHRPTTCCNPQGRLVGEKTPLVHLAQAALFYEGLDGVEITPGFSVVSKRRFSEHTS